jgi:hypothetical protein
MGSEMKITYAGFEFEAEEVERIELFETFETYGVCITLHSQRHFTSFHLSRPVPKLLWIKQSEREHLLSSESFIDIDRNGNERLIPGYTMVPGHDRVDFLYAKYVSGFNRTEEYKQTFFRDIQQLTKDVFDAQQGMV